MDNYPRRLKTPSHIFEVEAPIGEGLQGRVFRVRRRDAMGQWSCLLALKILKSETLDPLWGKQLERMIAVRSRHCAQVFGWEWIGDQPALVLELVEGINLEQLTRSGRLTAAGLWGLVRQIHLGLKDLMAAGLCHGDLSLTNVMVDANGCVKLLDYGLGVGAGSCHRVTPAFAAPEVLKGARPSGPSDLFSLGAIGETLERSFLGSNRTFGALWTQLRAVDPACRAFPRVAEVLKEPMFSEDDAQAELSHEISRIIQDLAQEKNRSTRTLPTGPRRRSKEEKTKRGWPIGISIRAAAAFFWAIINPMDLRGEAVGIPLGRLQVRTSFWVEISLDDRYLGYAPIVGVEVATGQHRLKWRSARGQGAFSIDVAPGQDLKIHDRSFGD